MGNQLLDNIVASKDSHGHSLSTPLVLILVSQYHNYIEKLTIIIEFDCISVKMTHESLNYSDYQYNGCPKFKARHLQEC